MGFESDEEGNHRNYSILSEGAGERSGSSEGISIGCLIGARLRLL
ncbi:MAG: hypothetical protein ABSB96_05070 [Gaiellaceae bacterium]